MVLLSTVCGCQRDPAVAIYGGGDRATITIRSRTDWECTVPFYLDVADSSGWRDVSGSFFYCSPGVFKAGKGATEIRTEKAGRFIVVWSTEDPNTILAFVDESRRVVFPPSGVRGNSYHDRLHESFDDIKRLYRIDDVKLQRQ